MIDRLQRASLACIPTVIAVVTVIHGAAQGVTTAIRQHTRGRQT
jgi:hypothetical protein